MSWQHVLESRPVPAMRHVAHVTRSAHAHDEASQQAAFRCQKKIGHSRINPNGNKYGSVGNVFARLCLFMVLFMVLLKMSWGHRRQHNSEDWAGGNGTLLAGKVRRRAGHAGGSAIIDFAFAFLQEFHDDFEQTNGALRARLGQRRLVQITGAAAAAQALKQNTALAAAAAGLPCFGRTRWAPRGRGCRRTTTCSASDGPRFVTVIR